MSDRRLVLSLALVALPILAAPVVAQLPGTASDSMLRCIHLLDSVMIAQSESVDSVRRSIVRRVPPVDVHRGSLSVRTDSTLALRVQQAVDSVAQLIDRQGGPALRSRMANHVMMVIRDSTRALLGMRPLVALYADTAPRWSVGRSQTPANPSVDEIAAGLATMVEQIAMQGADSAFAAWLMVGRIPLRTTSNREQADRYIELVTTESAAVRRCRTGDVASCLDMLGIDSLPGGRLERWYAPEDYRSMLRTVSPPREDSVAVAAWIRCRDSRDESGCRVAAAALPNDRVPLPVSASTRLSFLRDILDAGGAGAYDRLLSDTGTVRARLTSAAAEPLDATVTRWLDRVERSRPERMHLPPTLIIASLGWTTAFLALALIRRTSWA